MGSMIILKKWTGGSLLWRSRTRNTWHFSVDVWGLSGFFSEAAGECGKGYDGGWERFKCIGEQVAARARTAEIDRNDTAEKWALSSSCLSNVALHNVPPYNNIHGMTIALH
jgi:hypothetical protein